MISMSFIFFSCFLVIVLTNAYLVIFYLMLNFVYEKAEKLWMMLSSTKKVKHFSGGQVEDGLILLISQWILFKLFFFFFFLAGRMYSTLALLLDHSHYLQAMLLWGFNYKLGLSTSVLNFDRSWTTATDPPVLHYWWNLWASTNFCTNCCSVSLSVFILRGW